MRTSLAPFTLRFFAALMTLALSGVVADAQKIVDPSKVAPEFREAAEKRRAEQFKQLACNKAAVDQKIAPRDKLQFISDCFDKPDETVSDKPSDISATRK